MALVVAGYRPRLINRKDRVTEFPGVSTRVNPAIELNGLPED